MNYKYIVLVVDTLILGLQVIYPLMQQDLRTLIIAGREEGVKVAKRS